MKNSFNPLIKFFLENSIIIEYYALLWSREAIIIIKKIPITSQFYSFNDSYPSPIIKFIDKFPIESIHNLFSINKSCNPFAF